MSIPPTPDLHMSQPSYTAKWPVEVMQLHFTDWEALNPQLIALIESELAKDNWIGTDRKGTTRGGWHSAFIQDRPEPAIQILVQRIWAAVAMMAERQCPGIMAKRPRFEMELWMNVNPAGSHITAHDHSKYLNSDRHSVWTGTYYLGVAALGNPDEVGGRIVFQDRSRLPVPRTAAGDVPPQDWALTPQDGLLNIFPSTLYHRVEPHRSDKHRYAFAFDIRSPDIGVPLHEGMHLANWRWTYFFGPMLVLKWCETKVRKLLGS
jgi:uncharacterized protein (TIGR02466 family)